MNIIIHCNEQSGAALRKKVAAFQAKFIIDSINFRQLTLEEKERLLDYVVKKIADSGCAAKSE